MIQIRNKIFAAMTALVMVLSVCCGGTVSAQEKTATKPAAVVFSIERFTIGQGYFVEPIQVNIKEGESISDVFIRVAKEKKITHTSSVSDYGFFLTSIDEADTGIIDIPKEISAMPSYKMSYVDEKGNTVTYGYDAPSNEKNDGNTLLNHALGEYSYNEMAGWMFMLNNEEISESANNVSLKNGDVIRLQFSVYGYGADLGFDTESWTGIPKIKLANRDVLMKEVATTNDDMLKDVAVKREYENAKQVLITYNAKQETLDSAVTALKSAKDSYSRKKENTTQPQTTAKKNYPKVGRAVIKKVKNVKTLKAKISVKKLSGVKGYQYKYANNRKFKKATVKVTTKATFTTKKLKKKQRCYVKVRAYTKVNKTKVFGRWSKVKSTKIRK